MKQKRKWTPLGCLDYDLTLSEYSVCDFHYIDEGRCLRPLREAIIHYSGNHPDSENIGKYTISRCENILRQRLAHLFTVAGWEGDGEIDCIFVPPFLMKQPDNNDGWDLVVYHVKQGNNGTSWLAIPKELASPQSLIKR